VATPHDALFRSTFGQVEHARSLLRFLAPPEVATGMTWASLRAWPTAQTSERLRLQHADLLFAADWPGGDAPIFFLIEHKAGAGSDVVRQVHRYVVHVDAEWQRAHSTVPFVVPVVIRHGRGTFAARWRSPGTEAPSPVAAALARFDPQVRILVDDLELATEADLLARPLTPLAKLTLLCLRAAARATDAAMAAALERWAPLIAAVGRTREAPVAIHALSSYALHLTDLPPEQVDDILARAQNKPNEATAMSTADRLIAKGRTEGRTEMLLRLLATRFGDVPAELRARVQSGSSEDLDRWADRVFAAQSLADVFAAP